MRLVPSDAPERQFVDFCALRALFNLCWDCTLWVTLTADRECRARLGAKDRDHLPSKTAKKLVIGLIPFCRQLTQFFELGLWQLNKNVKPNIRVTRPGKVASGVNVGGAHIQGRQSLWRSSGDSACYHERAPKMKRQIGTYLQGKMTLLCDRVTASCTGSDISDLKNPFRTVQPTVHVRPEFVFRGSEPDRCPRLEII
jgi:hypothetical protein